MTPATPWPDLTPDVASRRRQGDGGRSRPTFLAHCPTCHRRTSNISEWQGLATCRDCGETYLVHAYLTLKGAAVCVPCAGRNDAGERFETWFRDPPGRSTCDVCGRPFRELFGLLPRL